MTYIEWRDELAGYLTGLNEGERKKIFAYYAEMYADKRDLGKSEREVIADFGAPYDVAQKILSDGTHGDDEETPLPAAPEQPPEAIKSDEKSDYKTEKSKKRKKGDKELSDGKLVFRAILWGFICLLFVCWCCYQLAEAVSQIFNVAHAFANGDAYTGIVATGHVILNAGLVIILVCLCVLCVRKVKRYVKKLRRKSDEKDD